MKVVLFAMKIVFLAIGCAIGVALYVIAVDVDSMIRDAHKRLNPALTHIDEAAGRAAHAVQQIEIASRRQQEASDKAIHILDSTERTIRQADETIAIMGADVSDLVYHANGAMDSIKPVTEQATATFVNAGRAIAHIDDLIAGPDAIETLKSAREMSAQLALAAINANLATAHMNSTAASVDAYIARITRPASTLKQLGAKAADWTLGALRFVF